MRVLDSVKMVFALDVVTCNRAPELVGWGT
jgi:hypothetical protein